MSSDVYLMTLFLFFGTILLIVGIRSLSSVRMAGARAAGEAAYRELAAQAATTQAEATASLGAVQSSLSEVSVRLAAVEKLLRDVG